VLLLLQIVVLGVALRARQSVAVLGGAAALVVLVAAFLRAGARSGEDRPEPGGPADRGKIPEGAGEAVEEPEAPAPPESRP
jgi:hypothetical protein